MTFFSWYTSTFSEDLPEYIVRHESQIFYVVEQLRLVYGGKIPIGPWPESLAQQRGPITLTGQALGVSPMNVKVGLSDSFELVKMNLDIQLWRIKQLQELADMGNDGVLRLNMIDKTCAAGTASEVESDQLNMSTTHTSSHGGITKTEVLSTKRSQSRLKRVISDAAQKFYVKTTDGEKKADTSKDGDKWVCSQCSYATKLKSNMSKHLQRHNKNIIYVCEICAKQFTDKSNLNVHIKRHNKSSLETYECQECGKQFSAPNNLRDHMKRHSSPKFVYSGRCGLTYCSKFGEDFKDLLAHLQKTHKINSLHIYNQRLINDQDGIMLATVSNPCDCPEHNTWIYRWVGPNHNCYLCECKYRFRGLATEDNSIVHVRLCKYKF